jgi:hypothetical protein
MTKVVSNKPVFIMLYGYPGSGKTYFSRQLTDNFQVAHVQSDRIRHELFEEPRYDKQENSIVTHLMDYMTEEFLNAGISVIYDVNAIRYAQRRVLKEMARRAGAESLLVWVQIDVESSFTRVARRDRRRSDDRYAMTLDRTTFDSLINNMQNPQRDENNVVISGKHPFKAQLSGFMKKLRETGLINSEDASSKVIMPELVNLVPNAASGRVDYSRRNIVIR